MHNFLDGSVWSQIRLQCVSNNLELSGIIFVLISYMRCSCGADGVPLCRCTRQLANRTIYSSYLSEG